MAESSPSRVSGKLYREVTVAGVKYQLTEPMRHSVFADEELVILSRRKDPLEFAVRACSVMPANKHAAIWEGCSAAASRGIPTQEEKAAYDLSPWKSAFMFWNTLSVNDPLKRGKDLSDPAVIVDGVRKAVEVVSAASKDEYNALMYAIGIVSQDNDLKNWFGPRQDSGTQKTDDPASEEPPPSTQDSPSGLG